MNLKTLFRFMTLIFIVLDGKCADKTFHDWAKESRVCFDVQRRSEGLELIGRESGHVTFKLSVLSDKIETFGEYARGNFQLRRL